MAYLMRALVLLSFAAMGSTFATSAEVSHTANPIRKVVMMLQNMQAQVKAEGEKELEMYDKFMCYCKTGVSDLEESIATAKAKIASLTASNKADLETKKATDAALAEHTASRDEAKQAMSEATAIREKEAAAYAKFKSDSDQNIAALKKATAAIESGVGAGAFLQTAAASRLKKFAMEQA